VHLGTNARMVRILMSVGLGRNLGAGFPSCTRTSVNQARGMVLHFGRGA